MDENFTAPHHAGHEEEVPVVDAFGNQPFDELNMSLSVRCGTLNLTLGELRNLAPGSHRLRLRVSDVQESKNTENVARILPNTRWLTATFRVR